MEIKRDELVKFRKNEKKTQQEMANLLDVSLIQYQFLELGKRNPSFSLLKKFRILFPNANICKIFSI